jgi:signal peptidase II
MSDTYKYMGERRPFDARPLLLILTAAVILLDRLSKLWVVHHIQQSRWIQVIPGFFRISDVHNNGAAFSLFAESLSSKTVREVLIGFSVVAIVVVLAMIWRAGRELSATSVALVLGGALGNLYDRVKFKYVIDFLAVRIYHYNWPDFNVADSCIVIGACLLILDMFRSGPESAGG